MCEEICYFNKYLFLPVFLFFQQHKDVRTGGPHGALEPVRQQLQQFQDTFTNRYRKEYAPGFC